MGESKEKLITAVKHYQDSLERHTKTGNVDKLLHAIEKLAKLPIKVCHLEETGVGRTVNGLKKFEGSVGENARGLVDKWKNMVKGEEEEEERARLENKQEMQEEEEEDEENDTSHEDNLQIIEPEEETTEENIEVINNSSHRQSSSSNRQSHSSKNSSRHKKSKRQTSSDSDSSGSNHQSKRHKSSKNYRNEKDSDSDSESSDSSRERSSKTKYKSRKSSSESGDDSSNDSQEYSSSAKHKSKSSKESKDRRYKKSSSDSDRDTHKSRDKYHSSKDKSRDHSKSKSEKESSSKKEASSKSRSEIKHEKDKKSSSRSHDKKKESSRSHRENGKTSEEKKRHRESSADKEAKRQKNEYSDNQDSSSSKNRDKDKKKSEDSSRKDTDKKKSSSKDKPKSSVSKMVDLDCIDSGSGTSFAAALGMLAPVTTKPKKKIVDISQPSKSSSSNGTSSKSSSSKKSSSKRSSSKESSPKSSNSKESSSKRSSSKESSSKRSSSKESSSKRSSSKESSSKSSSSNGTSPSKSHYKTSEATNSKNVGVEEVDLFKTPTNLEPLPEDIDISNLLPQITPHYKPLGVSFDGFRRNLTDDEALSRVITAKHQRTKVYSGNKTTYTKVPSLFDICCRILQDNIDALEYTGGVPYSILKPILEKANPDQLYQLEFHNPYLIEDSDELWQLHCQKEFRNKKKEEMESGREMYLRCLDEREAKLKALTANIKQSQDKSMPVRQTKLAYIDSVVKPPRNIARKQARNGTILDSQRPAQTTQERLTQIAKAGEAGKVVVPKPGRPVSERSSSSQLKPKKAPLMAKTLSLLKNRFGRR
ncbi:unnamed protein product [Ceutorhynchus assimilis]|uniref:TFIIS N-terminal domain-containing protein n=1 Tax=Ceutorhynchus assimilis TaxID=467358 RepID=A0A9N9MZV6_9CUCU|nr:unnamed protein product [Ceutorhynchus assimilis]